MLTRRSLFKVGAVSTMGGLSLPSMSVGQEIESEDSEFFQLENPPIEAIDAPVNFGYSPATSEQKAKVNKII
ncbi:hypothetical protein [Rhizobium sp. Root1204]|uniref:hypothetical protein n=1 Tax=Rhizobium sp. Root1204 TaxID=1736428 RepID=UPI000A499D84|nr:hypothetical protein [Rhizobium sp. Root1204]